MATDRCQFRVDVAVLAPIPLSGVSVRERAVLFLKHLQVNRAVISVVFVRDAAMRCLNRRSLGHDYVTDIITFDLSDDQGEVVEGELVIAPGMARRNALMYGESFERELLRCLAHGFLHLKGFDDATASQRALMRKEEDALLARCV